MLYGDIALIIVTHPKWRSNPARLRIVLTASPVIKEVEIC